MIQSDGMVSQSVSSGLLLHIAVHAAFKLSLKKLPLWMNLTNLVGFIHKGNISKLKLNAAWSKQKFPADASRMLLFLYLSLHLWVWSQYFHPSIIRISSPWWYLTENKNIPDWWEKAPSMFFYSPCIHSSNIQIHDFPAPAYVNCELYVMKFGDHLVTTK